MFLDTAKYRSYSFYCTELLRENQHGTCKISIKPRLGLKDFKDDMGEEASLEFKMKWKWKKILKQWKPVVSLAKNTYTAIENSNVAKNKQNRLMILSSCAFCG